MTLKFRNGDEILTLYVEKVYDDGWAFGWCPERENHMSFHPGNMQIAGKLLEAKPVAEKEGFEPSLAAKPGAVRVGTHNAAAAPAKRALGA